MCLLITGTSATIREQLLGTTGLIRDIYFKNGDGLGAMFLGDDGLVVTKTLPANAAEAERMVEALPDDDRELALHWRWKTHGDIDMENCHPYQINETAWLMHNGILATGNAADPTKSDTWHFVRDYLAEVTDDLLHHAGFKEMVGEFIGNNKFAIMTADGRLSVVNKDQGISHGGVWYSNTYAWTPSLLIPGYGLYGKRGNSFRLGKWSGHLGANANAFGYDFDDEDVSMLGNAGAGAGAGGTKSAEQSAEVFGSEAADQMAILYENIENALYQFDSSTLAMCIEQEADMTIDYLLTYYKITQYSRFKTEEWSIGYCAAMVAWTEGKKDALLSIDPMIVAETLIQCCDYDYKEPTAKEAETPALTLVQ